MEMKFAKFKTDERCKKLERSLKLALLRKSGKTTNEGQASPFRIPSSMSSINTDTQDLNYTATSFTQTFQTENEVVSSSNNLRNIMAKRRNMYNCDNQLVTSSSIKKSLMEKNHFDSMTVALGSQDVDMPHGKLKANLKIAKRDLLKSGDYALSPMAKNSCSLPTEDKDVSDSVINSKVKNAKNNRNDNIDSRSPPKLGVSNITNGHERTFFNWRVMLNDSGNLLVKGKLESGKVVHSKAIAKRLTATSVQSIFKHTYHLIGSIVDNRNELPDYVRGKFHNGFPDDWENVHQIWLSYVSNGSKPSFHWPTKITDSDDDIKSEVTDCTFLCVKEEPRQRSKLDIIPKKQIPNDLNVQLPSSGICSNDQKAHTSEAKTDNASKSETYIQASKNRFISSGKMEVHDMKIWNKENQYKHENEKMHKIFFHRENTMRDLLQQDKIDIIIKNLLHKDCPKEYILKILQMFDFLNDVFSFRIDTDETNDKSDVNEEFPTVVSNNNSEKSNLYSEQMQDNKTEINSRSSILERHNISPMKQYIERNDNNRDVHKIPSRILEKQSEGLRNTSGKVNDMHVPRSETKNTYDSENETYTGVPKIISDCILKSTERYSFKRCKYKKKRKTTDVNPVTRSDIISNKRFKEDRTQMHYSSSSDDNIENNIEDRRKGRWGNKTKTLVPAASSRKSPDNVPYDSSVSITEDEELQVKEKLDHAAVCNRKETDDLVYNCILNISSTDDDELELSNSKFKNTRNVESHRTKELTILSGYDGADRKDDRNTENNIRSYLDIAKCNAFKNHCLMNTNKRVADDDSTFSSTSSNGKVRNKDTSKSKLNDITCINDGKIIRSENSPRVRQTPRGYECQVEPGKARGKGKFIIPDWHNIELLKILPVHYNEVPVSVSESSSYKYLKIEFLDKSTDYEKVMEAKNGDNKIVGRAKDPTMNEFVSTDKCKLLCNWVPRVVNSAKSNSEIGLVFEGKLLNEAGHVVHRKFITERIHKRLSPVVVETTNHELYQLVGDLHDPKHIVPKEIVRQCRKGCPSDINQFCKLWISLQEGDASKATSKEEETATDLFKIPTSSKGRKKFPPLRYWNGERVTVKDDKVVYTAGNCRNFSTGSLTDNMKDRSILQERNKLNEHLKTVEATETNAANEEIENVLKYIRTSVEKARIEEGKRHERLIDSTEKDDNTVYHVLKHRTGNYTEREMQYDTKCRKSHKTSRDNDVTAQLDEHKKKYSIRQESPAKMQNLKYLCYRNIPPADDILSDDQISQF